MFDKPSLILRISIGKAIGLLFGLAGFIMFPYFMSDVSVFLRWGVLFWYTTLGAIIGVFGVFNYHPILKLPMPWWFRAPLIGAWMNFVLTFFAYDNLSDVMVAFFGVDGIISSPFWFVVEGALVGWIIGYFATSLAGEGKDLL